jgi:hypothetical protein
MTERGYVMLFSKVLGLRAWKVFFMALGYKGGRVTVFVNEGYVDNGFEDEFYGVGDYETEVIKLGAKDQRDEDSAEYKIRCEVGYQVVFLKLMDSDKSFAKVRYGICRNHKNRVPSAKVQTVFDKGFVNL